MTARTTYLGFVTGETILGANILRDFMAGIRDVIGGRSSMYEGRRHVDGHRFW